MDTNKCLNNNNYKWNECTNKHQRININTRRKHKKEYKLVFNFSFPAFYHHKSVCNASQTLGILNVN